MDITQTIALTMGVAWASGINLYAALFMLGYLGATGNMDLPPDLQVLSNPLVLFASGFMYCVEFFADKTPGVDSAWDAVHTFIRIPAGALLAAGAVGDVNQATQLAAGILGGTLAAGTHTLKAGTRVLINTSPEPFSNWTASIAEDVMVFGGLWVALHHPVLYIVLLVLFILMMIWLLPKLWRAIKRVGGFLARMFRGRRAEDHIKHTDAPPPQLPPQSPT
jgi:hypothetical protein